MNSELSFWRDKFDHVLSSNGFMGIILSLVMVVLSYGFFALMGIQGLVILAGGMLAVLVAIFFSFKFPIAIGMAWFLSMSGFHTLVMLRMPGLPDFSFPRLFMIMLLILIPLGPLTGRRLFKAPYGPDLLLLTYTFYVFINLNTIGDPHRFSTWLSSCFAPLVGYVFAKQFVRTPNHLKAIMGFFILISTYFWVVAIGDHFNITAMVWPKQILDRNIGNSWYGRSRGPFLQPALFGQIIGMYLIAHLFMLTRKLNLFWKTMITINTALGSLGLLYTYTRGGWLGTAVGVAFLAVVRPQFRKLMIGIAFFGIIIGALGLMQPSEDEFLQQRMGNTDTIENRLGFMANAVRMVRDHPLFGVGYFQFTELRHLYNQGTEIPFYGFIKKSASAETSIHDIYLGRAAEEGLVGLGLFLGFYISVALIFLKRWRRNIANEWFDRDMLACIGGMCVVYFVGGMAIDFRYFDLVNVLPCFLAGIIVGYPDPEKPKILTSAIV